ncbi:MAG TPA: hypothetical protein VLF41_00355 [Candidatus Nanoarchaeia archaeon]|nr:hypothetical protein [Candidatus Nanoarchaeia archaeon]
MSQKTMIWGGMTLGSTVGSILPTVFGAGWLSPWSILTSAVGGILGIWLGFKLYQAI